MRNKSVLWLALLVTILTVYAIYDFKSGEIEADKKTQSAKIVSFVADQIQQIRIQNDNAVLELKKSTDGWKITKPIEDWADSEAVDAFISTAQSDATIDTASEGDKINWELYGLDKNFANIEFTTNDNQTLVVAVSKKKNFEQNTFLRRNQENKVLVANSSWQVRANKIALDFRDKRLIRKKIAGIESFYLKNKDSQIDLTLKDGKWKLTSDQTKNLDQNKVRELLQNFVNIDASDFMTDNHPTAADIKKFYLHKPIAEFKLKISGQEWSAKIAESDKNEIYALASEPQYILKLNKEAIDKVFKTKESQLLKSTVLPEEKK